MPTPSGSSWARLDADAPIGASSLTVDRQLDLNAGDKLVVTTTDYMPGHSEEVTVKSNTKCGTEIKIAEKLKYAHNGSRFKLDGVPVEVGLDSTLRANGAETRAAVGVLTRSIRIVSGGDLIGQEFPAEASGYYFGGHLVVRQGFKTVQIQGVEFYQMGQGAKIGHYPVHFHHARIANPDTFVRDSSIHDSMTRWIVLHGTHRVALERNVGYLSIGHGFYLEDGTEVENKIAANLGVFARAAVKNVQNPRLVPGILAAPNLDSFVSEAPPYRSDYDHPTVFWIMNAYNDFTDNMAVGAGTCGVCYWLLPGAISTMSREQRWTGYASIQNGTDRAGMAPLKSFVGNGCSAAMTAFQTITATEACQGVGPGGKAPDPLILPPVLNPLAPISVAPPGSPPEVVKAVAAAAAAYYPKLGDGGHFPTQCTDDDCSITPVRCGSSNLADCLVTTLDRFTTSFNWAAFNFAAIWLRPQWYLVTDSVITDSQQAGLTMVTGGGYSESDVVPGHWALVRRSVFIGNTQDESFNPYASNGGPFNPKTIRCAMDANLNRPGNFCLSIDEGVSHQVSNFGMYQRLFSVYDGPAFQDSNAYLNITRRTIDDCKPFVDKVNKVGRCDPVLENGKPRQSAWIAGFVNGLPMDSSKADAPFCYMPNAAIGWKQPNGFFYPPAFHSLNLFFKDVEIRHFVISPLFLEGTNNTDTNEVAKAYCIWNSQLFTGFAGNDRQTVLNDDDGTLTGYAKTTVINLDAFFAAPVDALQCRSDKSSRTSPYEYVSTVVYPACVLNGTCALPPDPKDPDNKPNWNSGDWNRACTNENCYGVPLFRQDAMPLADKGEVKSIRMMGQETSQRSSLTVNNGTYYIDTTVDKDRQLACGSTDPKNPCVINVFRENQTYYLFLIFAKESTTQTYRFYVGDPKTTSFEPANIHMVQAQIGLNPIKYDDLGTIPAGRARWLNNDKDSSKGVIEVELKLSDLPDVATKFKTAKVSKCGPTTYCKSITVKDDKNNDVDKCVAKNDENDDSVCKWGVADLDCPSGGCYGIRFTLPQGFATLSPGAQNPRPPAVCVPALNKDGKPTPFNVQYDEVPETGVCPLPADLKPRDFCS
jgi:hypothetical protein